MIKAKKSLGQHFLIDDRFSRRIVEAVSPTERDILIEIGPGNGAITRLLLGSCGYLTAIEIDPRFVEQLRRDIPSANFNLIVADVLNVNWQAAIQYSINEWRKLYPGINEAPRVRLVANLPYYISTPIIERLIKLGKQIFDMTLMLQEEVVDRIVSAPGGKAYGYLSVVVQYHAEATKLFRVPPTAFQPVPKVWSAILRLNNRPTPAVAVRDEAKFFALVSAAFAQRRKTILNNLKAASSLQFASAIDQALMQAHIDAKRRAETLSLEEFAGLYGGLFSD